MAKKTKAKSDEATLDDVRQRLRAADLRATPARIAVLGLLAKVQGPISHQEAFESLSESGVDKSTLFRTLNDLAAAGLARRMELGDHVWRYEAVRESASSHSSEEAHPHLLCVDCGSVTCLTQKEVAVRVSKSLGPIEDVLLKGHCSACQEGTSR